MEKRAGFENKYFLEKVYLSGYKSIRRTEIEFKNNLSIIIGKNGSGKTNFLSFLDKVVNNGLKDIYSCKVVLNLKKEKRIKIDTEKKIHLSEMEQFASGITASFSITVDQNKTEHLGKNVEMFVSFLKQAGSIISSSFIKHGIPKPYFFVSDPFTLELSQYGLPLFNIVEFLSEQSYLVNFLFLKFMFGHRDIYPYGSAIIFSKEIVEQELSELIFNQLDLVIPHLKRLTPIEDIRFSNNFNVYKKSDSEDFSVTNLFLEFKINDDWLPFSNLSDGTRRLLYIISEVALPDDFVIRYDWYYREDLTASRIILIEEPELGIHPHQLRKLMLFLKEQSRNKQIIITTHSPEVLDILEPDELDSIILSWYDKENGTQLRHLTDKEKEKAQAYIKEDFLSDYWMHSNLEPAN